MAKKKNKSTTTVVTPKGTTASQVETVTSGFTPSEALTTKGEKKDNLVTTATDFLTDNNIISQSMYDELGNGYVMPESIKELGDKRNDDYSNLKDHVNSDIITDDVWDATDVEWVEPKEATEAYAKASEFLNRIQSGKTSYSGKVDSKMKEIEDRDPFEYDVDNDQLFQQALASAMNSGKTAMQDTIGQASSLTGGYSSTFATSAGNQAYNEFIEDAYNNLPQYYKMAMEAYQMETDNLYRELGMYMDADNTEWTRMVDGYNASMDYGNTMHNNAWDKYTFDVNTAISKGNLQVSEWSARTNALTSVFDASQSIYTDTRDFDYTTFRDQKQDNFDIANLKIKENQAIANNLTSAADIAMTDYRDSYAIEFDNWNAQVKNLLELMGMANGDYWNQETLDQNERFHTDEMGYKYKALAQDDDHFNKTYNQNERFHTDEMTYKNKALAQGDDQFNKTYGLSEKEYKITTGDTNMDGKLSDDEKVAMGTHKYDSSGNLVAVGNTNGGATDYTLSDTEITNISKIYSEAGGGEAGFKTVLTYLSAKGKAPTNDSETETIRSLLENGNGDGKGDENLVTTGTVAKDFKTKTGTNFTIDFGGDRYEVENEGKVEDSKLIESLNKYKVNNGQAFMHNGGIYVKYANGYFEVGAMEGFLGIGEKAGYQNLMKKMQK